MAINPKNIHPHYHQNIKDLQSQGYDFPKSGQIPHHLERLFGSLTFLINEGGDIKSVNQATGEVKDVVQRLYKPLKRPSIK